MSGVQDSIDCPQCEGHDTYTRDYGNKDGTYWELCSRCGCREGRKLVEDKARTPKAKAKAQQLLGQGKLEEAARVCQIDESCYQTRRNIENFINSEYLLIFKEKDGNIVYRYYKHKGRGAYMTTDRVTGGGLIGPLYGGKRRRKEQIKQLLEMRSQCDVKITEVLEEGTLIEYL